MMDHWIGSSVTRCPDAATSCLTATWLSTALSSIFPVGLAPRRCSPPAASPSPGGSTTLPIFFSRGPQRAMRVLQCRNHSEHVLILRSDGSACLPRGSKGYGLIRVRSCLIAWWHRSDGQKIVLVQTRIGKALRFRFRCGLDRWTASKLLFAPETMKIGVEDQRLCIRI